MIKNHSAWRKAIAFLILATCICLGLWYYYRSEAADAKAGHASWLNNGFSEKTAMEYSEPFASYDNIATYSLVAAIAASISLIVTSALYLYWKNKVRCEFCKSIMHEDAKICPHCQSAKNNRV